MKSIKTEKEYEIALKRAEELIDIDPEDNTAEAEELDLLTLLIFQFEDELYPVDNPGPS